MRVKICGITQPDQAVAIANLGATELGFICVAQSPRYVTPAEIQVAIAALPPTPPNRIGVFANASFEEIRAVLAIADLNGIQLHGQESPEDCAVLKAQRPDLEVMKAFRIRTPDQLQHLAAYAESVDTFLLDAFDPQQLGGTGHTLDWAGLKTFQPSKPWFLAGGLKPENVELALSWVKPDGIDLSSGVENQPGDKNLLKVKHLFQILRSIEAI